MKSQTSTTEIPPLILDWNSFKAFNVLNAPYLVVDTESNGKDPRVLGVISTVGIALACRPPGLNQIIATYVPIRHTIGKNVSHEEYLEVKELVETHKCLIMHNAKHDRVALENIEVYIKKKFYDTMLTEHFNNGKQLGWSHKLQMQMNHKLDTLSRKYGGLPKAMPPEMVALKNMMEPLPMVGNLWWGYISAESMFEYSANDAYITAHLHEAQQPKFKSYPVNETLWDTDQKFIAVLNRMEQAGVRIDTDFVNKKIELHEQKMTEIKDSLGGLNPNSPKDLKTLIVDQLGIRLKNPPLTDTGNLSFNAKAMEVYEPYIAAKGSPVAKQVIAYRGYSKTRSANYLPYIKFLSEDGRLRANFNLHATVTRRLSVNDPALQQIPRMSPKPWNGDLKKAFIAREGYTLWEIDYSQLELRIIARYAKSRSLLEAFNDPKRDVFREMAVATGWAKIYGPDQARQMIKTFSYMVSYGAGVKKVMTEFGISFDAAKQMKDQFFNAYPEIDILLKDCMKTWKKNRYIKLWTGRRIQDQYNDKPWAALDYLAQGGGAEIVERAMIRVDEFIDWNDCKMVLQVHDSLAFEIKNGEEDKWLPGIIERMMDVNNFGVTFRVETKKWGTEYIYGLAA